MTDVLKRLEDSIDSARKPRGRPSHEILNMHNVFAVIDECHRLRALELEKGRLGKHCAGYNGKPARFC